MSVVNILHLSDLHYSHRTELYNSQVVLRALLADLKIVCDNVVSPDVVIFSGDLAKAADEANIYNYIYDDILDPISKITRCSEQRIILCPGNHDAHQSVVEKNADIHVGVRSINNNRDSLNEVFLKSKYSELTKEKFNAFYHLEDFFGSETKVSSSDIHRSYYLKDAAVDVLCVNSAWISGAGTKLLKDEGNLLIPEAVFETASFSSAESVKILVTHHPLGWLKEYSVADVEKYVPRLFDMHLFGHVHDPRPISTGTIGGSYLSVQSGALYQGRDRYCGYSIISFDRETKHSRVIYRSYFDTRREFDEATDLVKGGVFFSSSNSEKFFFDLSRKINRDGLRTWLSSVAYVEAIKAFNEGLGDKPVCEVFVPPPMYTKIVKTESEDMGSEFDEEKISFDEIVLSRKNYIINGKPEYGKTTLLQQIAVRILSSVSDRENSLSFPILINFSDIKPGHDRVIRALRSGQVTEYPEATIKQLLEEGLVTILIDDVNFSNSSSVAVFEEFVSRYPRNRIIITTINSRPEFDILGGALGAKAATQVSFEHIFLKPFNRRLVRTLLEKWDPLNSDREDTLKRIIREFSSMNIPVTAMNSTIILTIYDDLRGTTLLNRSTLVQRFIEHVLERRSIQEALRKSFDYMMKDHVLSYISEVMARENSYSMNMASLIKIVESYLNKKGITLNPVDVVNNFVSCRILSQNVDGDVSFRYRAFLEFFIASQMAKDNDFKRWILAEDRYLTYLNEIQYYAGLNRNDAYLIELVSKRFINLDEQLEQEFSMKADISVLDMFKPPNEESIDEIFDEFEKQINAPSLTRDERDEALEGEIPSDAEQRQNVFRPMIDSVGAKWTWCLFLYSGLLKNLELIDDPIKRKHLKIIFQAWGALTLHALWLVPLLSEKKELKINGISYKVILPAHFTDAEVAREISVLLPNGVASMLFNVMGTEKLQRQLIEPQLDDASEPAIIQFYRQSLISDLRLTGWSGMLSPFREKIQHSRYLLEVFARRLADMHLIGDYMSADGDKIRAVCGDIIGYLQAGRDRNAVKQRKGKAMQRMKRKALLQQLRVRKGDV